MVGSLTYERHIRPHAVRQDSIQEHRGTLRRRQRVANAAALATFICRHKTRTINELLCGQVRDGAEVTHHGRFEGTGGGEGVAGAAVALIFDGGDVALLAPVDAVGDRRSGRRGRSRGGGGVGIA